MGKEWDFRKGSRFSAFSTQLEELFKLMLCGLPIQ
jgi:hypothetical protein